MNCILFEDEHLLVVNKPAGVNTHAPAPYAGEGIYEWLKHREPRWANLATIHRLDKETSGVLVFAKTAIANRSLTEQFTGKFVRKQYLLLTDRRAPRKPLLVQSSLIRAGDKYVGRPGGGEPAETMFRPITYKWVHELRASSNCTALLAEPRTGRTHQIRVHAAENGFPILGDTLYGGSPGPRVYLHALKIGFQHPATGESMQFETEPNFDRDPRQLLRGAFINPGETNCCRLSHGASDGHAGWFVDRFGDYLLGQSPGPLTPAQTHHLDELSKATEARGAYCKQLHRQVRQRTVVESSPLLVLGQDSPNRFYVRENGLSFELSFEEGYSVGLFLDQRDNRRRLMNGHISAGFPLFEARTNSRQLEVLNTFAYTCSLSVCAAKAGARVTSVDLSKKYLDWGKRNFALNGLDAAAHDFIYGDVFDWLKRFAKKQRRFDLIIVDPPTFSASKQYGIFRVEKDYEKLIAAAVPLLENNGVLFASANAAHWPAPDFVASIHRAIAKQKRAVAREHYFPQPPDFPVSRAEPAYLKSMWMQIANANG